MTTNGALDPQQERIMDKIRKLLALSTSSNPAEAAAASAKAQELVQQYNLELSRIQQEAKPVYLRQVTDIGSSLYWRRWLMSVLAQAQFCHSIALNATKTVALIGEQHNIDVVVYLYGYIVAELERLAREAYRTSDRTLAFAAWRNTFCVGAVSVLKQRFAEQEQRFVAQAEESRALVVVKDSALQEAVKRLTQGKISTVTSRMQADADAYERGQAAGRTIPLRHGVQGGEQRTLPCPK
jgi:hypothetical protein